jgi:hypothetical protein
MEKPLLPPLPYQEKKIDKNQKPYARNDKQVESQETEAF